LIAWKIGNLWGYESFVDGVTDHIVGAAFNPQTPLPGVLAMVMTCAKPIANNYVLFVNPFPTNGVKTT
jgi:hypothetical protein